MQCVLFAARKRVRYEHARRSIRLSFMECSVFWQRIGGVLLRQCEMSRRLVTGLVAKLEGGR